VKEVTATAAELREQCLSELDAQLRELQSQIAAFERKLRWTYPIEEDFGSSFPTKERLEERLQSLTDIPSLTAFVGELKDDLPELNISHASQRRQSWEANINKNYGILKAIGELKPLFPFGDSALSELRRVIKQMMFNLLSVKLTLQNSIEGCATVIK
jgi:hypothetical protein